MYQRPAWHCLSCQRLGAGPWQTQPVCCCVLQCVSTVEAGAHIVCTSSSAQAVLSASCTWPPTIWQVARHSIGRMRLPPASVEYLHAPWSRAYNPTAQICVDCL